MIFGGLTAPFDLYIDPPLPILLPCAEVEGDLECLGVNTALKIIAQSKSFFFEFVGAALMEPI